MTDFELIEVVIGILGLVLAVLLKLWDEKNNRHWVSGSGDWLKILIVLKSATCLGGFILLCFQFIAFCAIGQGIKSRYQNRSLCERSLTGFLVDVMTFLRFVLLQSVRKKVWSSLLYVQISLKKIWYK